jgi:hypothetical protein
MFSLIYSVLRPDCEGIAMDKRETESLYLDGGIDSVEGRHLSGANGKPASGDPIFREKQR